MDPTLHFVPEAAGDAVPGAGDARALTLAGLLVRRPAATFFLRAGSDRMAAHAAGIRRGDVLVVDRAEDPRTGDVVVTDDDGALRLAAVGESGWPAGRMPWGVVVAVVRPRRLRVA